MCNTLLKLETALKKNILAKMQYLKNLPSLKAE
jgi:hypothetical protein